MYHPEPYGTDNVTPFGNTWSIKIKNTDTFVITADDFRARGIEGQGESFMKINIRNIEIVVRPFFLVIRSLL